jgi:inorganic pyrophosphatase/exopolyphosphatase
MSNVGEHLKHQTYAARDETELEHAVDVHWADGQSLLSHLPKKDKTDSSSFFGRDELAGAVFCGHVMTDLDSIAGAIGAAYLYGGDAARASEINTETEFALKEWGCDVPDPIEDALEKDPSRNVCLVDFQQQSQLNKCIPQANIVGIIDHHALQSNTVVTEKPIFVDIRPWGCMSSIIAHGFAVQEKVRPSPNTKTDCFISQLVTVVHTSRYTRPAKGALPDVHCQTVLPLTLVTVQTEAGDCLSIHRRIHAQHGTDTFFSHSKFLPKNVAGMLLSAILSDTLNLRSPTTTAWDERIVAMLVQYLGVTDVNALAARQFRAKSHSLSLMTPYALVNGDVKKFKFESASCKDKTYTVAYSVVETTDAPASLARAHELLPEMRAVKAEDASIDAVLLAVVDIVALTSTLLVCGRVEASLAIAAYGGEIQTAAGDDATSQTLLLPGLVSRKKDFVPALTKAVSNGWAPPVEVVLEHANAVSRDFEKRNGDKAGNMKRSRSMADVAKGNVVVDYSEEPSGKIVRLAS